MLIFAGLDSFEGLDLGTAGTFFTFDSDTGLFALNSEFEPFSFDSGIELFWVEPASASASERTGN